MESSNFISKLSSPNQIQITRFDYFTHKLFFVLSNRKKLAKSRRLLFL